MFLILALLGHYFSCFNVPLLLLKKCSIISSFVPYYEFKKCANSHRVATTSMEQNSLQCSYVTLHWTQVLEAGSFRHYEG